MVEDNTLVAIPVEVGQTQGSSVEIVQGLSSDRQIVVDVRGLVEGEKVEVITQ